MNYASTSSIREVIKYFNVGDKTFETDFNTAALFGDIAMRHYKDKLWALQNRAARAIAKAGYDDADHDQLLNNFGWIDIVLCGFPFSEEFTWV